MTGNLVLLALILAPTIALPPQASTRQVAVQVVDQSGAKIPAALITVSTTQGGSMLSAQTDADGNADLELPRGEFVALIESQGFCPQKRTLKVDNQSQAIKAELKVDSCPGPCQVACVTVIPLAGAGDPPTTNSTPSVSHPVVNFIVEDQMGVRIPLARIGIRAEKDELIQEIIANKFGEATVFLVPGTFAIRVGAPGFESWQIRIGSASGPDRSIKVVLRPGGISNAPLINDNTQRPQVETSVLSADVSSVTLGLLNLPARKLHSRFKPKGSDL